MYIPFAFRTEWDNLFVKLSELAKLSKGPKGKQTPEQA